MMDNQNPDDRRRFCPLDLVLLLFMSLISLPFFLLLVSDLLAYGPYLFNHIKAIIPTTDDNSIYTIGDKLYNTEA